MHKTESLNFDGTKNPRQVEQKDRSVDAQDFEGSRSTRSRKRSNKLLLWCGRCCGLRKKKKDEKEPRKKSTKKSIFEKLKKIRCWGRRRKDKDREEREEDDEKRDSSSYESRAGTSARDGRGHLIVDKSDSRISFEERRRSRVERSKEKSRKSRKDSSRPEKSVSYADTRDIDKSRKRRGYEARKKYDESLRDITKSCCYLCTENSLAIAAAMAPQAVLSDKSVEVDVPEMLEKSCSPIKLAVHVRTVKSLIRVKIRDTCTSYAEIPKERKPTKVKKKRKKFRLFPKIKRTQCPVRRTVGCVTETSTKSTNSSKPKEKRTFEPCYKDKGV